MRPDFVAAQEDFIVLPLSYTIGSETYFDAPGEGLSSHAFYDRLRGGETSITSQITTVTFTDTFRPLLEAGKDVLYIAFSSALSGTYQSGALAAQMLREEMPGARVWVVDSLCASGGQALCVHEALRLRERGVDAQETAAWVEGNRQRIAQWFTVDDLNFLKAGGRCSPAAAFFGTLMSIKPVLHVSAEGKLVAREKVRGRLGAMRGLLKHMEELAVEPAAHRVFISHADCLLEVEQLRLMIHEQLHVPLDQFVISDVGPVIGTHAGPGVLALIFMGKPRT